MGSIIFGALQLVWGALMRLFDRLRPEPRGLMARSAHIRQERERALVAADKVEKRLGAVRVIIEAADGAVDVVESRRTGR
jgi:hypothetical protein